MNDVAVTVDHVSKRFRLFHERNQSLKATILHRKRSVVDEFWALRNVSLEVPKGATVGLIGENGSGKSTLLKCMTRILPPDAGTIATSGRVSALLELGAGFHPELSGRENVFLNGAILGLDQRELRRRFDEIVDFAGLGQFIDQPVKNYSSGMYVRLGFSVAVNVDPDVLLVDEVLAVGDETFQRKCHERFLNLKDAGKTIVIVSHDMGAIRNLCDHAAWLEGGELKTFDAARQVVDDYLEAVQGGDRPDGPHGDPGAERWGSGEGRIERVELLDDHGSPVSRVRTGDAVTVRFHYQFQVPVERPVFGMSVHTLDGIYVAGPNTRDADFVPDHLEGRGFIDFRVDRLLLLPGTYEATVAMHDYSCLHPYDFRARLLRFEVDAGEPRESYGLVSLGGEWQLGGVTADP